MNYARNTYIGNLYIFTYRLYHMICVFFPDINNTKCSEHGLAAVKQEITCMWTRVGIEPTTSWISITISGMTPV